MTMFLIKLVLQTRKILKSALRRFFYAIKLTLVEIKPATIHISL
ncbi:hypothetical protein P20429_0743 [Pseudoalteromonas sp. BSi20429]|uniref:Uncharacterized protein n=1 Tax=Pseudoalteromonas arctica A 37-1-2 TaxID=1117313 RepID=A0A290S1M7_9GAMM|nr:hypothetical protein PARC_a1390 [Pseudoalteromonas arctica A 37-1-2]GAA66631.1 hypothetical protein P20429_0743 [Pseudoalteromonas sp. BSi20429]